MADGMSLTNILFTFISQYNSICGQTFTKDYLYVSTEAINIVL